MNKTINYTRHIILSVIKKRFCLFFLNLYFLPLCFFLVFRLRLQIFTSEYQWKTSKLDVFRKNIALDAIGSLEPRPESRPCRFGDAKFDFSNHFL